MKKKYQIRYKKPMVCPLCEGTGVLQEPSAYIKEIIKLRRKGLTYRQIGKALRIAPNTAHYHYQRWKKEREKGCLK